MAEFNWEARTFDGNLQSGVMQAPTRTDVEDRLKQMRLSPIKIKKRAKEIIIVLPWQDPVPVKSKVVFTRQLATMVDAGLPLVQCMEVLAQQEPHPYLRNTLYAVKQSIESGSTFADALEKHPRVFDELFVNLIRAGEAGGLLDTILNRLAVYMEKAQQLRARVKSALRYPIVVLGAALLITGVLLVKVIPSFAGIYSSVGGGELPALTQMVINISDIVINYLPIVIAITIGVLTSFVLLARTRVGRLTIDRIFLKTPVIGPLIKKAAIARFTRTLGTLIASGVPILEAMSIVAKTSGNKVIEGGILYARDRISEGKNIASPLMELNIFPKMVVQMIAVGENTGALDVMLTKIADFYEEEVDTAVDGLTSVIEPLMMIFIGGLVAFVLIAMYLPIFGLADNLQGGKQ
jgi:type IV pilus assembly protein PilC